MSDEFEPMGGLGERPARPGDITMVGDETFDAITGQKITPPGPGSWRWTENGWERVKGSDYDARQIVRDLAESDVLRSDMYADPDCTFCRQFAGTEHRPDCEWRRAVEWVRDQGTTA